VTADRAAPLAIEARALAKRFGPILALEGIDFTLESGGALVVLGPNGAGKTTLLRLLTLGLRPDAGSLRIVGHDPARHARAIRSRIGLLSHESQLYDDLSARQNLEFFASLYGVPDRRGRVGRLLAEFELERRADDPLRHLSRGMRQRVSIARALVHDPELLFLDEPFAGLDTSAAARLRRTLATLREAGRTLLLVTHDPRQGLDLADRWLALSAGRIAGQGAAGDSHP
jgi:heme exporter protein A